MPMNRSSILAMKSPLTKKDSPAWSYLVANLAIAPGIGSLKAGRKSGYGQLSLAVLGTIMSLQFASWMVGQLSTQLGREMSLQAFQNILTSPDFPSQFAVGLLGLTLFGFAWLWGLLSGLQLIRAERNKGGLPSNSPPPPTLEQ